MGPATYGPYRRPVVDGVRVGMATVPRRTGDGRPVRRTVAMHSPGFGGGRVCCSHAKSRHRYGRWSLEAAFGRLLLGVGPSWAVFLESVLHGPVSWSLSFMRRFLGVGPIVAASKGFFFAGPPSASRPKEGGPVS